MFSISHNELFISAVLITGGTGAWGTEQSAEIYHPDLHTPCVLPDLPDSRYGHTQDGSLMCGGRYTPRSCRRWNADNGTWDLVTESLTKDRHYPISWTPEDGSVTYLMGGWGSFTTSEAIHKNNSVTSSFPLQHITMYDGSDLQYWLIIITLQTGMLNT